MRPASNAVNAGRAIPCFPGARTGAAIRLPEADRVAVLPHGLAGGHLVAGDDLVFASLLLGEEKVTADGKGRPAGADWPAPEFDRREAGPVCLDPHAAGDAVAIGATKAVACSTSA